ncbi:MAG: hypothetical protein ACQKBY_06630, partial [Verrucomicrobiales bacterium]
MVKTRPQERKPRTRYWAGWGGTALTHYLSIGAYVISWQLNQQETRLSTALFFIGLLTWMIHLGLIFYFRERSPTLTRLSLFLVTTTLL